MTKICSLIAIIGVYIIPFGVISIGVKYRLFKRFFSSVTLATTVFEVI